MALSLTNSPQKYLYFEGRKIRIKPYIRNVLFCLEVLNDSVLSNADKMDLCIKVLVSHWHSCIPKKEKLLEEYVEYGREYYAGNLIYMKKNGEITMINLVTGDHKILGSKDKNAEN